MTATTTSKTLIERAGTFFERHLNGIVGAWLFGVAILSLRLLVGWWTVQRLRRRASLPASESWQALLHHLSDRLRVARAVKLVESLLFYHPAVWWVSHRIRIEREHCCDDIAVQVCGDKVAYAKALVALEELRVPKLGLAMSSHGGNLLTRVARLLGRADQQHRPVGWAAVLLSMVLLTMAGALGAGLLTPPDKPTEGLPNDRQPTPTKATGTNTESALPAEPQDREAERIERENRHVRKQLSSPVDVDFTDVPLSYGAIYLGDYCKMAVVIDSSADFVDGGRRRDAKSEPITLVVRDELSSVLSVMLDPLGLSYCDAASRPI